MPIYEYRCDACGHEFELWQKMGERPKRTCVKCRKRKAKRQISLTSFLLKGGGWYADGYASARASSSDASSPNKGSTRGTESGTKKQSGSAASGASNAA